MRRGRWANDLEELRRTARNRVIPVAALVGLGVPGPTVARRCQDGGPWRGLLPGIVMLGNGPPTRQQEITAALLPTSLRRDPSGSMATLVAAYGAAARRPRPPVRAVRTSG
jgi:hypothetical protein